MEWRHPAGDEKSSSSPSRSMVGKLRSFVILTLILSSPFFVAIFSTSEMAGLSVSSSGEITIFGTLIGAFCVGDIFSFARPLRSSGDGVTWRLRLFPGRDGLA